MKIDPQNFVPATPGEMIGQGAIFAAAAFAKAAALRTQKTGNLRLAFRGAPGCGKTTIVNIVAAALALSKFDVETINGKNVTIDTVREWQRHACYGSMSGGWKVKVINEMDLIPVAAQDLLLTYLDELPAMTAVLGTSNADSTTLTTRFETRFQFLTVGQPTQQDISRFLNKQFGIARKPAQFIANVCAGNVRQACLDASTFQTFGTLPEKREVKTEVTCTAGSEAARKAWETRRQNGVAA